MAGPGLRSPVPRLRLARDPLAALQKGAEDPGHVLRLVHVDVVIARDFHELEPLEREGAW